MKNLQTCKTKMCVCVLREDELFSFLLQVLVPLRLSFTFRLQAFCTVCVCVCVIASEYMHGELAE